MAVADGVCAQGRKPEHIAGVEPVRANRARMERKRNRASACAAGGGQKKSATS